MAPIQSLAALAAIAAVGSTTASEISSVAAATTSVCVCVRYPDQNLSPSSVITLRGNFSSLSWSTGVPMQHVGADTWMLNLTVPATCDVLQYKALVDDSVWQVGANEQFVLPTCVPPDSGNAFFTTAYPWFGTQAGRYEYTRNVYSPQLGNVRDLVVYLPPSYDENYLKPFDPSSVLIMHDGQNLFNASTSTFGVAWMCQDTVNPLIATGAMREIIIVGVDNTPARTYEYTYSVDPSVGDGGGADLYLDFLQTIVMPLVMTKYRIVASTQSPRWGMLGSSLGGLLSCYAGWTRPNMYGFLGCMSSSFWWNNEDFNNTIIPMHATSTYPPVLSFYLDSGDAGPDNDDVNQTQTVRNTMLGLGYPYAPVAPQTPPPTRTLQYYLDHGGQHSEKYWGARFHVPMTYAFPPELDIAIAM